MNLDDVRAIIAASDRPDRPVMIGRHDGLPGIDNVSVLVQRSDGCWYTAYFERGRYHDERRFDDEDAACRDFLEMIRLPAT